LQNGIKGIKKQKISFYKDSNIIYLEDVKRLSKTQNRKQQIKSLFTNKNLFKNRYKEIKDNNEDNLNNFEKLLKIEEDGYILWKEHLPRLTMQLNPFKEFVLVDDNSKVENGSIEIKNHFLIPANQKELSFPLIFKSFFSERSISPLPVRSHHPLIEKNFSIDSAISGETFCFSVSMSLTLYCLKSSFSASSCCVKPKYSRAFLNLLADVI
jgi:hypothetical protein